MTTITAKTAVPKEKAAASQPLYLLSALVEDAAEGLSILEKILASNEAKIVKTENLGRRVLAYPVKKPPELELISLFFKAEPEKIRTINETIPHEEKIKRYLLSRYRGDLNGANRPPQSKRLVKADV